MISAYRVFVGGSSSSSHNKEQSRCWNFSHGTRRFSSLATIPNNRMKPVAGCNQSCTHPRGWCDGTKKSSYENIFKSETLVGAGRTKEYFWNKRTAGSYFQPFGRREPWIRGFWQGKKEKPGMKGRVPVISKPTKSRRGLGVGECCRAEYREMKMITPGSQVQTTMVMEKQVK